MFTWITCNLWEVMWPFKMNASTSVLIMKMCDRVQFEVNNKQPSIYLQISNMLETLHIILDYRFKMQNEKHLWRTQFGLFFLHRQWHHCFCTLKNMPLHLPLDAFQWWLVLFWKCFIFMFSNVIPYWFSTKSGERKGLAKVIDQGLIHQ